MKRKNNELKMLALLAKKRLMNSNYLDNNFDKKIKKQVSTYYIKNARSVLNIKGECKFVRISNDEDENLIKSVYEILNNNEDVLNPLGLLCDKKHFCTLNECQKQFYMLNLAEKYNKIKENYFSEKMA